MIAIFDIMRRHFLYFAAIIASYVTEGLNRFGRKFSYGQRYLTIRLIIDRNVRRSFFSGGKSLDGSVGQIPLRGRMPIDAKGTAHISVATLA